MRKFFYLMAVAIMAVAFTACSDEDTSGFVVNDGETEVSINRLGGEIEIPITASGEWTAELDDNSRKWATVWTGEGEGSGKAVVYVSHLSPRKQIHERKTTLTITADGKKKTVNIRQFIGLVDGETVENGEMYDDLWNGKGIGYGLNPETGELSTDPLINLYGINALIKENPARYALLYSQTYIPKGEATVTLTDTLEDNVKSIVVAAHIDVTYAKMKFGLDVNFKDEGKQYRQATQWVGSYSLVRMRGSLALGNIRSFITRDPDLLTNETQMVLSPLAMDYYDGLKAAYDENDENAFKQIVNDLCNNVGPLIVTYAELGGNCLIQLIYDEYQQADSFKVGGKITAAVKEGLFALNADVDVKYSKFGEDIWKNSTHKITVDGGSSDATGKLMAALESGTDSINIIRKNIKAATEEWAKSINCYETAEEAKQKAGENAPQDNTAVIRVRYAGVWTLFPFKYQSMIKQYVKEYIAEEYLKKNKKLWIEDLDKLGLIDDNNQLVKQ